MAFEDTAHDALLPPGFSRREFSVFVKARHLRARPGAAWRAVVRSAGTQHEVAAVGIAAPRRSEKLDVVDDRAILAGHPFPSEAFADRLRKVRSRFAVG